MQKAGIEEEAVRLQSNIETKYNSLTYYIREWCLQEKYPVNQPEERISELPDDGVREFPSLKVEWAKKTLVEYNTAAGKFNQLMAHSVPEEWYEPVLFLVPIQKMVNL